MFQISYIVVSSDSYTALFKLNSRIMYFVKIHWFMYIVDVYNLGNIEALLLYILITCFNNDMVSVYYRTYQYEV